MNAFTARQATSEFRSLFTLLGHSCWRLARHTTSMQIRSSFAGGSWGTREGKLRLSRWRWDTNSWAFCSSLRRFLLLLFSAVSSTCQNKLESSSLCIALCVIGLNNIAANPFSAAQAAEVLVVVPWSVDPCAVDSQAENLACSLGLRVSHLQKIEMVRLVDMLLSERFLRRYPFLK